MECLMMVNLKLTGLICLLALAVIGYIMFNIILPENEKPDMKGHIIYISNTQQNYSDDVIGSVLVEGLGDKVSVKINKKTSIFEQQDNGIHSTTFDALKIGQSVEIKFTGPILESYPAQATADKVVILNSSK